MGPFGETLLEYSVYDALGAGFGRMVFVIRADMGPVFRNTVGRRLESKTAVAYAYQTPPKQDQQGTWGTACALLAARHHVSEPFAVINADDFYGRRSFQLMSDFLRRSEHEPLDGALVGFQLRQTLSDHGPVSRALCECQEAELKAIVEIPEILRAGDHIVARHSQGGKERYLRGDDVVSMNFWGFTAEIFDHLHRLSREERRRTGVHVEFQLPAAVGRLLAEAGLRIEILAGGGPWFGLTCRQDLATVRRSVSDLITLGEYPEHLWQ